jgi:uncharacterized membrane protein
MPALLTALPPTAFVSFLLGGIYLLVALISLRFPPKKINHLYGYRTKRSMKSQQHWDFAQKYSSEKLKQLGLWYFLLGALIYLLQFEDGQIVLHLALTILPPLVVILQTESAIKSKFPNQNTKE